MNKKIKVVIVLIVITIALFFGIDYAKERVSITRVQKNEQESYDLFKEIREEVSKGDVGFRWRIEINLDKILEEYPDTEAAEKVEAFRKEYPIISEAGKVEASEMFATIEKLFSNWNYTEEQKELIEVEQQEMEDRATRLFELIKESASEWKATTSTSWIEKNLDILLKDYPNTEAAGKVEQFRIDYPPKLQAMRKQYLKQMEIDKVKTIAER